MTFLIKHQSWINERMLLLVRDKCIKSIGLRLPKIWSEYEPWRHFVWYPYKTIIFAVAQICCLNSLAALWLPAPISSPNRRVVSSMVGFLLGRMVGYFTLWVLSLLSRTSFSSMDASLVPSCYWTKWTFASPLLTTRQVRYFNATLVMTADTVPTLQRRRRYRASV